MNLERILKNAINPSFKTTDGKLNLTDGQILTARVTKLFPDQKAEIQIGNEKRIAQLEAPLTIGKRYHFQVSVKDQIIYLKVLSEQNETELEGDIKQLLAQLNIKAGKKEISFVKNLQKENIPFQKNELIQAFNMLNQSKLNKSVEPILKEMIQARLPITKDILSALQAIDTGNLSERLTLIKEQLQMINSNQSNSNVKTDIVGLQNEKSQVLEQKMSSLLFNKIKQFSPILEDLSSKLQSNTTMQRVMTNQVVDQGLAKQLNELIDSMTNESKFIKTQWNTTFKPFIIENEALFQQLHSQGALSSNVTFESWKNSWTQFMDQSIQKHTHNSNQTAHPIPFQLTKVDLQAAFESVIKTQQQIKSETEHIFMNYGKEMFEAITKQKPMKTEIFTMMKSFIINELSPLLPKNVNDQLMQNLKQNNPHYVRQLVANLIPFSAATTIQETLQAQSLLMENKLLSLPQIQELFIQNLKQSTTTLGLNYEQSLLNTDQTNQQNTTLKGMLLQLTQQQTGSNTEQAKQMIHFINGLQIQSVTEANQFIHASLQLPGGPLGLAKDMELEFSGKQKEDGTIDTDFCKIVFYLDLQALETTVIDMNVQKRNVMVTVFNDHPSTEGFANRFEPLLKEGLDSLSYTLSNINVRPLTEQERTISDLIEKHNQSNRYEGVDFRI